MIRNLKIRAFASLCVVLVLASCTFGCRSKKPWEIDAERRGPGSGDAWLEATGGMFDGSIEGSPSHTRTKWDR